MTVALLVLALGCRAERARKPATGGEGGEGGASVQAVPDAARSADVAGPEALGADAGEPDSAAPDTGADGAPARDVTADRSAPRDTAVPDAAADTAGGGGFRVLVLSKTLEYHHDSIPACQQMLRELGATPDPGLPAGAQPGSRFTVTVARDDLSDFTDEGLRPYSMLFWCSPTGTVFTSGGAAGATGMQAVEKFLTGGGAWGGVHSAVDFENTHQWPWFQEHVNGGNFSHHDGDGTPDTVVWQAGPLAQDHPVIRGIRSPWSCADEWYFLDRDPATLGFAVLGKLGRDQRPAVWVRELPGGGRSFYTIRGHNITAYAEPNFRRLVHQGILWAVRRMK
jgi:type 1 glutamine amidotransferase